MSWSDAQTWIRPETDTKSWFLAQSNARLG